MKAVYYFLNLRGMIPNVCRNITFYESVNSFKLGYMKYFYLAFSVIARDSRFVFYNPFDQGVFANAIEFFHGGRDWLLWNDSVSV